MKKRCEDCECYKCTNKNACFECKSCILQSNFTSIDKTKCQDRKEDKYI